MAAPFRNLHGAWQQQLRVQQRTVQSNACDVLEPVVRGRRVLLVTGGAASLPPAEDGDIVWAIGSGRLAVRDRRTNIFHVRNCAVNGLRRGTKVADSCQSTPYGSVRVMVHSPLPGCEHDLVIRTWMATLHGSTRYRVRPLNLTYGRQPGAGPFALCLLEALAPSHVVVCGVARPRAYWDRRGEQGIDHELLEAWGRKRRGLVIDTKHFHSVSDDAGNPRREG